MEYLNHDELMKKIQDPQYVNSIGHFITSLMKDRENVQKDVSDIPGYMKSDYFEAKRIDFVNKSKTESTKL